MSSPELPAFSSCPRQVLPGLQCPSLVCLRNPYSQGTHNWLPEAPGVSAWVPLFAEACPSQISWACFSPNVETQGFPDCRGVPKDPVGSLLLMGKPGVPPFGKVNPEDFLA